MIKSEHGFINAYATINHPMADQISMAMGNLSMASFPYTVEIAFFKNGEWVEETLPEFAYYADTSGFKVYGYVPTDKVFEFLHLYCPKV